MPSSCIRATRVADVLSSGNLMIGRLGPTGIKREVQIPSRRSIGLARAVAARKTRRPQKTAG